MRTHFRTILLFLLILCLLSPAAVSAKAFSASGGWTQKADGKWYYNGTDGKPVSGWQTIGGKNYYFDPADGNAMATGFKAITDGGKTYTYYFMDPSYISYTESGLGQMMTGWKTIEQNGAYNVHYFADYRYKSAPRGSMLSGFKVIDGGKYYFADYRYPSRPKGSRLTGWKIVGGKSYYFADSRCPDCKIMGNMMTGFAIISGKVYGFTSGGVLQPDWAARNVIVIDPGHSSQVADGMVPLGPGSGEMKEADNLGTKGTYTGVYEYALNLTVSLKLRDALQKKGYKVVMVRTTNRGKYSCVARADVANRNKTAVFLRIHANAAPKDPSKKGAMAICITPDNPFVPQMYERSRLLSDLILASYVKATGCYNEGVEERDDMIANNWSKVPTTLIELGYMTNKQEDPLMQKAAYQDKMVKGLVDGIDNYFKKTAK